MISERERIVAAARGIVESDGVDALSMRKLAAELDVAHTAIYWHVGGRDELVGAVVDAFLADLGDITPAGRTPRHAHGIRRARDPPSGRGAPRARSRSRWSRAGSPGCGSRRRSRSRARSSAAGLRGCRSRACGHLVALPRRCVRHARGRVRGPRRRSAGDRRTVARRRGPEHRSRPAYAHGQGFRRVRRCSRTRSKPCSDWIIAKATDKEGN